MHRPAASAARIVAVVGLALASLVLAACSSTPRSPSVARTNFTPKVELEVARCVDGIGCAGADRPDTRAVLSGPHQPGSTQVVTSVPDRAVLLVTNEVADTQRVTGTVKDEPTFDTGQMRKGDTTTIVLDTPGVVTITLTTTGQHVRLTVRPAPATKT